MSGSLASAQAATPASLPQAGEVWRYVCNVNPLSTLSEFSQVDPDSSELLSTMNTAETDARVHSATDADSVQLAISAALADSFKLASSTQLASSGLVPASLGVGSPGAKQPASAAGDKAESATLATIVWPGSTPPDATTSAPQPTVSSADDGSPSSTSPRSPDAHPTTRRSGITQRFSHTIPSAVPEIMSDDPIGFSSPTPSTIDLYPVAPRTPPTNTPLQLSRPSSPRAQQATKTRPAGPFIPPLPPLDTRLDLRHRDNYSRTPRSTYSPRSSSRSPLPRSSSFMSQPHDLSPASARGAWVRRSVRRGNVRLGAERLPSQSPSRHTPAAAGAAIRSDGSSMLRPSQSAIELGTTAGGGSEALSVDGSHLGGGSATPRTSPVRIGRGSIRRADGDGGSARSVTPPGSVAGSSLAVSPRLPWAPRVERRRPIKLGAASRSPAAAARHPPAAMVSSSFLDEYEDAESIMRLRRLSTVGGRSMRASPSVDMLTSPSAVAGASFFSGAGLTTYGTAAAAAAIASDGGRLASTQSDCASLTRRASLASRLGGGRDRSRYLRALYMSAEQAPPAAATPPGVPSLNFRQYDFALSRQFTFSDGSRITLPQEDKA